MLSSWILSLASVLVAAAVSTTAAPTLKPGTTVIERQFNETLSKRDTGFNYGGTDIRGVNLGGWLLLGKSHLPSAFPACHSHFRTFPRQSRSSLPGCSRTWTEVSWTNTPFHRTKIEEQPRMLCGIIGVYLASSLSVRTVKLNHSVHPPL